MITNIGKDILAKYLISQAPSYASYIAFGCGASPLSAADPFDSLTYAQKSALDFEMFRVPIISRGYVTENVLNDEGDVAVDEDGNPIQVSQIVFTAELPTEERYEITEFGVFSAGSNPSAGPNDSKILYAFSQAENWEYHEPTAATALTFYGQPLDRDPNNNLYGTEGDIGIPDKVFETNADNITLESTQRVARNERSRFLNNMVLMRGDSSSISGTTDATLAVSSTYQNHIHLNGVSLNLDKNSAKDELKLAFSIINKENNANRPSSVKVIVEFASAESGINPSTDYARFKTVLTDASEGFSNNRYFVITKKLEELEKSPTFSWNTVSVLKIYVSIPATAVISGKALTSNVATLTTAANHEFAVGSEITVSGVDATFNGTHVITAVTENTFSFAKTASNVTQQLVSPQGSAAGFSSEYYVGLDAIRLENVTTINPLYGLTGYTVVKNDQGLPIVKNANSSNLVEFRFAMDVA